MRFLNNVKWKATKAIIPDFVFSDTGCIYFLSIQFHLLKPEYILNRIRGIPGKYVQRILIVLVDSDDHTESLKDLNLQCIINNLTLILAWSNREAARYVETFKAYEHKSADIIKEKPKESSKQRAVECLTTIRHISTTNANNLIKSLGTMGKVFKSSPEHLSLVPGLGEKKIRRLLQVFNNPFVATPLKKQKRAVSQNNIRDIVKRLDNDFSQ